MSVVTSFFQTSGPPWQILGVVRISAVTAIIHHVFVGHKNYSPWSVAVTNCRCSSPCSAIVVVEMKVAALLVIAREWRIYAGRFSNSKAET